MADFPIRLRDREQEITLTLPGESCVSILAAARDGITTIEGLLREAAYYDETLTPALGRGDEDETGELASLEPAFEVDLVDGRLSFPGDVIDFARRGVLAHRKKDGELTSEDFRTYQIGRAFTLRDRDRAMFIDEKASFRNEKSLWSNALPPVIPERAEDVAYSLDGADLGPENLQELRMWTLTSTATEPTIDGRGVYSARGAGRAAVVERGQFQGAPTGPGADLGRRGAEAD